MQLEEEKERARAEKEKKRVKQKEMEKIQLEEEKAAKAEASKLKRQRELEKMRAKSIEMQEKVSLDIMLRMEYNMSQSKAYCLLPFSCKLREEEKEVDHRKNNSKDKARDSRRGLNVKSDAEKNAESLDVDFNVRKLPAMPC